MKVEISQAVEQQAGAVRQAQRQHVSDAAWQAVVSCGVWATRDALEASERNRGTVMLTVAEHDELLSDRNTYRDALGLRIKEFDEIRAERDALRAEVERLRASVVDDDDEQYMTEPDSCRVLSKEEAEAIDRAAGVRRLSQPEKDERLRKGRGNVRTDVAGVGAARVAVPASDDVRGGVGNLLVYSAPDALDPRLGIPQAEGEPCEPMSARPAWRWGPM